MIEKKGEFVIMDTYFDFFAKIIISFLGVSLFRSISYSVDRYYLNNEHLRDIYEKKLDLYDQLVSSRHTK